MPRNDISAYNFTSNQSREQAAKNGSKGGKASAEAKRRRKDIRLAMEALLEKTYVTKSGEKVSGAEAIAIKQMEKALSGDSRAFEVVRDTSGQSIVQKVMVAEVSQDVIDEVERAVLYEPVED